MTTTNLTTTTCHCNGAGSYHGSCSTCGGAGVIPALHLFYTSDSDGEVTDADQAREMAEDDGMESLGEVAKWLERHGWEPVTDCGICERPLDDSGYPICSRCARTAQATARYFPEGPERWLERSGVGR